MKITLRPHQEEALENLRNGSILWGGVGAGKSITAIFYYMKEEWPRDIYVITTAKKRDSGDWLSEYQLCIDRAASVGQAPGKLVVDSWNNIGRYAEVKDAFFIFDEQRLVGSGHWTKTFIKIAKSNRWILLSATPGDTWLDYIPVFCANGFYKNRTEFKREHVVYSPYSKFPKVDRYIGVPKLIRLRNSILVEMGYMPHTKRHSTEIEVDYDVELFDKVVKKRWHVFENRPLRDVGELFGVMRKVVNSHPSRVTAVEALLSAHPKLIVFYNFDYELELLRTLGESVLAIPLSSVSQISVSSRGTTSPASSSTDESTLLRTSRSSSSQDDPTLSTSSTSTETGLSMTTGKSDFSIQSMQNSETGTKTIEDESSNTTTTPSKASGDGSKSSPSSLDTFAVAEWNGHRHQPIPATNEWVYLVQYAAGSEGWNCVETDAMCFYSLTYSYKMFHQAHGRIDRMNTPFRDLYYYVLKSRSVIDMAVARSLRDKRSFNERKFVDIWT